VQLFVAGSGSAAGKGCKWKPQALAGADKSQQWPVCAMPCMRCCSSKPGGAQPPSVPPRPFVGLLGTVWGLYHALMGVSGAG
jgi:hypothetical protein